MQKYKLLCWNVNGIRAAQKKGFLEWMQKESPDILALQETKAQPEQLSAELINPGSKYNTYWNSAQKKGYSGVVVYSKEKAIKFDLGLGKAELDQEGRTLAIEYEKFFLFNIYFPNGKSSAERLKFKLAFYQEFLSRIQKLSTQKKPIIVCGDFNTAHREIDLARPKENSKVSGFLPEERVLIDKFIDLGFTDTFRCFSESPDNYTWWDLKSRARERNVGWRIDYFFISNHGLRFLKQSTISKDVFGSDHCPIGIELKF